MRWPVPPADEAKELARQAGGEARQVAQEGHELRTLTEQGRQELKSQAEAQTQRASQNLRTWSDQTRALAAGRPDEAGPLAGYVQDVSGKLSGWADNLDRRGFDGMVAQVQGFARRRPAAFIGLCVVAGFAVSRVGKTVRSEPREGRRSAADASACCHESGIDLGADDRRSGR